MTKTLTRAVPTILIIMLGILFFTFTASYVFGAVTTDKADYTPGETVIVSGDGYWVGETVLIEVTAPYGSESGTAMANGSGEFSWSFVLPNDASAFGEYNYIATGQSSGIAFSGTFTDNKNFTITFAGTGGGSISFSGVSLTPAPSTNPCTGTCTNALNNNATGTLTVTPNVGSVFTGWTGSFVSGGSTTCAGTTSPCTFSLNNAAQALTATFDSVVGTLQIVKHTVGGDDTFGFNVSGTTTSPSITTSGGSGTTTLTNILQGGGYSITETTIPAGWDLTSSSCTNGSAASTTISAGATTTCTFINTKRGVLSVKKVLVNDNGGSAATTTFSFQINGASTTPFNTQGEVNLSLASSTYSITELAAIGYTTTYSNSKNGNANCTNLAVTSNATTTCTIINDDQPGTLKIVKNTTGGNDTFTFTLSGTTTVPSTTTVGNTGSTTVTLNAGTFSLSEIVPTGWDLNSSSCSNGTPASFTIGNGTTTTCTFNNTKRGALVIIKNAIGGDSTFNFSVTGATTSSPSITTSGGSGTSTISNIIPGTVAVSEASQADWDLTSSSCTNGSAASTTISAGATTTCTFINTKRGVLSVKKVLVNDNGGTTATTSFSFLINGASTTPFEADGQNDVSVVPGTFTVTEAPTSGYATSTSGCTNVSVTSGATTTCTITNDDIAPSLTLKKVVVNDNGGVATTTDWTLTATGPTGFGGFGPSVINADIDAGTYDLSENGPAGYTASDWVCVGGNQTDGDTVEIGLGEKVICTITNDDIPPPPPPPPPLPCGCKLHTETIVSDATNTIGGGNAVPVATSSAWTASIPGATWIWQASSTLPNQTVAFEKSFTVIGTVISAQLSIATDNSYKVFIDGVPVAADANATNFTLATQDVYDLTANVTPGTHTLRIEVRNNGVFGSLNPAGLLYKFEIKTCPPPPKASILITICNSGIITNSTLSRSSSGGNTAGGSQGGSGSAGGDVTASGKSTNYNNGGASGGSGGAGGNTSRGGLVRTGKATSNATTTNDGNTTIIRIGR